jgi:hypothetical protein
MSKQIAERIASLRKRIDGGLCLDNLDALIALCASLAQDTPNPLDFFVLKHVFADLCGALEGEAVAVDRFQELTEGVRAEASSILAKIEIGRDIDRSSLESLVRNHLTQLALFRAG